MDRPFTHKRVSVLEAIVSVLEAITAIGVRLLFLPLYGCDVAPIEVAIHGAILSGRKRDSPVCS